MVMGINDGEDFSRDFISNLIETILKIPTQSIVPQKDIE